MPGTVNKFLNQHPVITETGSGLAGGPLKSLTAFFLIPGHPHALAATAGTCLEHDRIADIRRHPNRMLHILYDAVKTRYNAYPGPIGNLLGGHLVAHGGDGFGRRTDKDNIFIFQGFSKIGIFR